MERGRDREANAIIGFKAQGKSCLQRELAEEIYDLRSDKVVILNNTNPQPFQSLTFVDNAAKLQKRWHGIVRYYNPAGYEETINDVVKLVQDGYLRKGAIFFDDVTKYVKATPQENVKIILTDHRMYDLDLFFATHALRMLPKFCRAMVSTVTVFKTGENYEHPRDLKNLDYSNYEAIYNAWRSVMAAPRTSNYIQPYLTIETGV